MNKILTKRGQEILTHYQRFWGAPITMAKFSEEDIKTGPIFVVEFSANSENGDWVYATIGASDLTMHCPASQKAHPLELFLYSHQRNTQVAEFLASLAVYPSVHKVFFSVGDTVRGSEPVVSGSGLCDVLLTYPYFEAREFSIIHHDDKTHTSMVWVVPIYPSEHQFIRDNDWEALEDLFREQGTNTSDFTRKPVV